MSFCAFRVPPSSCRARGPAEDFALPLASLGPGSARQGRMSRLDGTSVPRSPGTSARPPGPAAGRAAQPGPWVRKRRDLRPCPGRCADNQAGRDSRAILEETMKAAVVRQFGQPLVIEDRPVPVPGPGQLTVRMVASGLCHTDIHAANGDWPVKPAPPFVPGHEGVGTVHAIGDGVTRLTEGDLVAVPWLGHACGTCKYCLTGWETLCLAQRNTGYSVDGGYAEYFLAEAAFATKVPAGVNPFEAAP